MTNRRPAEIFPPGEFLREELEARGWTQGDLADILGRPVSVINLIITGKRGISPETAKGLAAAFGTSPEFWLNLEASYRLSRSGGDDGENVSRRAKLYSFAPVKEMVKRGWIEPSDNIDVLEQRVTRFFEVQNLDETPRFAYAARKSTSYDSATPAQLAWLFRAKRLAKAVQVAPYKEGNLETALARLRQLLHVPQEIRHVPKILADMGIRLVLVQALPGTKIDGACFWIDGAPVVALALRYDRIDNFWFVLMHELGHVKNKDAALDIDLEGSRSDESKPASEDTANKFASEQLVPSKDLDNFIARLRPLYSTRRIEAFAQTIGVHPGIVVGQLHNRQEVDWSSHRRTLVPIREWITQSALTDGWGSSLPALM